MGKKISTDKKHLNKYKTIAWSIFATALIASLIAEHFVKLRPVSGIDGRAYFHAWFGFITCTIFILFSRLLGFFIKRQEGYYKENRND